MNDLVIETVASPRQRSTFIKSAWQFYQDDPHWIPPVIADQRVFLDPKRGVFFDHGEAALFLAILKP